MPSILMMWHWATAGRLKKQEIHSLPCELDLNINWEGWDFGACENCFQYKSEAELNIDGFVSFYPFFLSVMNKEGTILLGVNEGSLPERMSTGQHIQFRGRDFFPIKFQSPHLSSSRSANRLNVIMMEQSSAVAPSWYRSSGLRYCSTKWLNLRRLLMKVLVQSSPQSTHFSYSSSTYSCFRNLSG